MRSKSVHPACNQSSPFGSTGTTGSWGIQSAACTHSPSPASVQWQHSWQGICDTLPIHGMLLLLPGVPIWDRQHTNPTGQSSPHPHFAKQTHRAWSPWAHTEHWLPHLHPHRSAALHCQHFTACSSRGSDWVRFLKRNLGQNSVPWSEKQTHSTVGGSRLWLWDFTRAQSTFWSLFLCLFQQNQKHWASKPLVGPRSPRGVHQLKTGAPQYLNSFNSSFFLCRKLPWHTRNTPG